MTIEIDVTEIIKAYQQGFADGFSVAVETPELDEQLKLNNIDEVED